ncbi:unnamed protein product, partial [Brugia pahangi]|uniref:G_PROTEIN_RECEP_F1_2 domain-containing protein n=1 Tax=Brugia pahangi TaxID=6280 RepID=A0A0N4T0D6_BRUPA
QYKLHTSHNTCSSALPKFINFSTKKNSVILCDILGCLCIILNLFIISIIIRHRKKILKNIFYILVFHCSIVDLLRGCCLIIWGLPHTLISNYTVNDLISLREKLTTKYKFATMILRSCNLLTIFNLLIFTCNEFTVVHYPLFYRHRFRRRIVLIYLLFRKKKKRIILIFAIIQTVIFISDLSLPLRLKRNVSVFKLTSGRTNSLQSVFSRNNRYSLFEIYSLNFILKRLHYSEKSHCHWKSHLMCKYKHLVVIGTVLFVYILFLLPYSGIQLVAILHVTNVIVVPSHFALIKWSLQILTGLHAICQPLCYFRMVEFRLLACSGRQIRQFYKCHISRYPIS